MTIPHSRELSIGRITAPAPGHPVFFLYGRRPSDPSYVLKVEVMGSKNIKKDDGGGFYGRYGQGTTAIKKQFLVAIKQYEESFVFMVKTLAAVLDFFPATRLLDIFELPNMLNRLAAANTDGQLFDDDFIDDARNDVTKKLWVIMACLSELWPMDSLAKKADTPSGRRMVQHIRRDETICVELGRILACDVFFNNQDRAYYGGSPAEWACANLGNFFAMGTSLGGRAVFVGIDFYEPNKVWNNLFMPLSQQDTNDMLPWPGPYLKRSKKGAQRTGLKNILDDVNRQMQHHGGPRLFDDSHVAATLEGFRDGASRLKKFLNKTKKKPLSVKQRKARLSW